MKELSNWGRWGKTDEIGTLNLLTPATRIAAAKLVREGVAISLSRDADKESARQLSPFIQEMLTSSEKPAQKSSRLLHCCAPRHRPHSHGRLMPLLLQGPAVQRVLS